MVKHSQTIRRKIADELFECVWPFCGIGAGIGIGMYSLNGIEASTNVAIISFWTN